MDGPPPYHNWQAVPDAADLPPPPAVGFEQPTRNNADEADADRAHAWCQANRLIFPVSPDARHTALVQAGAVSLIRPSEYRGQLQELSTGVWHGRTPSSNGDCCLLTHLPLYFVHPDSPAHSGRAKTVYFELEILALGKGTRADDASVALGFCALPYPPWRLPGWERASLGVHSDVSRAQPLPLNISWIHS